MKQVNSLLDFADSASVKRVNYELQKILENIMNLNTDDKPRKLSIEVTLTPQNDRRTVALKTVVKKTLRPTSAVQTQMVFQNVGSEVKAYELTGIPDGQTDLFGEVHEQKFFSINLEENSKEKNNE